MFHYYVGTTLAAKGHGDIALQWLKTGALIEEGGQFSNAFLVSFLERHNGRMIMPDVAFADPRPFVHFAGVPRIKEPRERFLKHCGRSMPVIRHPLRIMDIGCGNGALVARLLMHLREKGKVGEIAEILLIDPSPAMISLAKRTVGEFFPPSIITTITSRIENVSAAVDRKFDVALSSLAYHHMPLEAKALHLRKLSRWIDHFLLFELDANHDTPELYSPELALSLYQIYGRVIDFVFAHDAPIDVAVACVDCFLMTEAVSILTQPRGVRTDYHMLRSQWHDLFKQVLSPDFSCVCDATAYADEYLELFTLHYGRY